MRMNDQDRWFLKTHCVSESDFEQMVRASKHTTYEYKNKKIKLTEVLKLIGRERYWLGIARSAFHHTAKVSFNNDADYILFDSSQLFRMEVK